MHETAFAIRALFSGTSKKGELSLPLRRTNAPHRETQNQTIPNLTPGSVVNQGARPPENSEVRRWVTEPGGGGAKLPCFLLLSS